MKVQKYKAKAIKDNYWIDGFLVILGLKYYIFSSRETPNGHYLTQIEVDPNTIEELSQEEILKSEPKKEVKTIKDLKIGDTVFYADSREIIPVAVDSIKGCVSEKDLVKIQINVNGATISCSAFNYNKSFQTDNPDKVNKDVEGGIFIDYLDALRFQIKKVRQNADKIEERIHQHREIVKGIREREFKLTMKYKSLENKV